MQSLFQKSCSELIIQENTTESFLTELCQFIAVPEAIVFSPTDSSTIRVEYSYPQNKAGEAAYWFRVLKDISPKEAALLPLADDKSYYGQNHHNFIIAIPCMCGSKLLALYCQIFNEEALLALLKKIECFLASRFVPKLQKALAESQLQSQSLAFAASLHTELLKIKHFTEAGSCIARELCKFYQADEVYVANYHKRHAQVFCSNTASLENKNSPLAKSIAELAEESCDQNLEIAYPSDLSEGLSYKHRLYSQSHQNLTVLTSPVRDKNEEIIASITIVRQDKFQANELMVLRTALNTVSPYLDELRNSTLLKRLFVRGPLRIIRPFFTSNFIEFKMASLVLCLIIVASAIATTTDTVDAPFNIRAKERSVITAPYDSFINVIHLQRGDRVDKKSSVLASLDTVELRLKKSELALKKQALEKEAAEALRQKKTAEYQIALLDAEALNYEILHLELYLKNAQVKSNINGVILDSPFEDKIAAPVKKGETLFRVANLNSLYAEMQVLDVDAHKLELGLTGRLATVSAPEEKISFTVRKIYPSIEESDTGKFFRVELALSETPKFLQPGVEGMAKIEIEECSYLSLLSKKIKRFSQRQIWF